jgi:hypothetical protein
MPPLKLQESIRLTSFEADKTRLSEDTSGEVATLVAEIDRCITVETSTISNDDEIIIPD